MNAKSIERLVRKNERIEKNDREVWGVSVSQSLASILVHIVFSTKHRKPMIKDSERDELHGTLEGSYRD